MKDIFIKSVLVGSLVGLSGCAPDAIKSGVASAAKMEQAKVWLEQVKFNPTPDVNGNAPITVDILVFYDAEAMGKVAALTADKYFQQKDQLKKDYSDQIDFFSFDVVPGQRMKDQDIELSKASGLAAVAFARYSTPGPHRVAIGPDRIIQLDLEKNDFKITTIKS
ncbi:hypothetical protein [Candidatus Paracaedibacter symbiosus]|uniref:hypothetical protein n=1 Tax=Candidatus Paracaedibacter symbiosus TaxID=244582 RepID=UPI000509E1D3|nr:hypothetical protein [Candidatus Paracaedibacter symbiosus]